MQLRKIQKNKNSSDEGVFTRGVRNTNSDFSDFCLYLRKDKIFAVVAFEHNIVCGWLSVYLLRTKGELKLLFHVIQFKSGMNLQVRPRV